MEIPPLTINLAARDLADSAPFALAILDGHGRLLAANALWSSELEAPPFELGQTLAQALPANRYPFAASLGGPSWQGEVSFRLADGTLRRARLRVAPWIREGLERGMTVSLYRIDEIQAARDAALSLSEARLRLIANANHELATPMNALVGCMDLISGIKLGDEPAGWIQMLRSSTEDLQEAVESLITISRLESSQLSLEAAPFSPAELSAGLMKKFSKRAEQKGLQLAGHWDRDLPAQAIGDAPRIAHILSIALDNAIKFSPNGQVQLSARIVSRSGDMGRFEFEVLDTGPGLAGALQSQLFTPFSQGDSSTTRREQGLGLGLAVARALADLMGATVRLEQAKGGGSKFILDISLNAPLNTRRILVAAGSETSMLADALSQKGYEVEIALDAARVTQALAEKSFDLLLLDRELPASDGLLAPGGGAGAVPTICLAAAAPQGPACDNHVTMSKPFRSETILDAVQARLRQIGGDTLEIHEIIDLREAKVRMDSDKALFLELAAIFAGEYPKLLDKISKAIQTGNATAMCEAAHSLKGSLGNLSARRAVRLATALNNAARKNHLEGAPATLAALKVELARFERAVAAIRSSVTWP